MHKMCSCTGRSALCHNDNSNSGNNNNDNSNNDNNVNILLPSGRSHAVLC